MKRKIKRRLVTTFIVLVLSAGLSFAGLHVGVEIEPVTLTTPDNVLIRGWLVSPEGLNAERLPAAVFCHGLLASKDIYQYGIRRLARSGMRVLALDMRGHGRSSGFSDFGKSESRDALAGVDYLLARPDVSPDKIALIGHSLGGITATRAGSEDAGKKARAVAAIYCWQGFQAAVEDIFGPLERGFIGNLWSGFAWRHSFPLDEGELRSRDVLPLLGPDRRPPNYLLIHAHREVLISLKKAEEVLARAAGVSVEQIQPGVTFGDTVNLTARRFVLVKGNHGSEAVSPATYSAIEDWLNFCLNSNTAYAGFDFGFLFASIGAVVSIAAILYLYSLIRIWLSLRIERRQRQDNLSSRPLWHALLAGSLIVALSAPAFKMAGKVDMPLLVRTWLGDVLCTYALARIALSLPLIILAALYYRGRFTSFCKSIIPGVPSFNDWSLGLAPVIWLVASLSLIGLFLWIPPALPKDYPGFLILFFILFIHYLIEESVFRGIVERSMKRRSTSRTGLVTGLAGGLAMSSAFIACFPSWKYSIQLPDFPIPMLPVVLIIFTAAYYAHSSLTTYLYRRTGNILVPAASMSLLLAWMFTSFGVRAA